MKGEHARKVKTYEAGAPDHGGDVLHTFEKEER